MTSWDTPLPPATPPLSRDELVSRINASLADNNVQGISAEDVRSRMLELTGSVLLGETDLGIIWPETGDATARIQAAIIAAGAAGGRGEVTIAPGIYAINTGNIQPVSNVTVHAVGATFNMISGSTGMIAVNGGGAIGTAVPLTADLIADSKVVSVGSEVGFILGDMVKIKSNEIYDPARSDTRKGELGFVASTSAGGITLSTAAFDTYPVAQGAMIQKITPLRDFHWIGGTFIGTRNSTHTQRAIALKNAINCSIEQTHADGVSVLPWAFDDSFDCHILDWSSIDCLHPITGYGAGISLASRSCSIQRGYARNIRHGVTCGGSLTDGGVVREWLVADCTFDAPWADGCDSHGNCDDAVWERIVVNDGAAQGFNFEGRSISAIDCVSRSCASTGMNLSCGTNVTGYVEARGNRIIDCSGIGLTVGISPQTPTPPGHYSVVIDGNLIERSALQAIRVSNVSGVSHNLIFSNNLAIDCSRGMETTKICYELLNFEGFSDTGNIARGCESAASAFRYSTCQNGSVTGNVTEFVTASAGVAFNFTDGCSNISVSGNTVIAPAAETQRGVGLDLTCSNIIVGANNFQDCPTPVSPNGLTLAAGVLTQPYVAPYAISVLSEDGLADTCLQIVGLPLGLSQTYRQGASSVPITFQHGGVGGHLFLGGAFTTRDIRDRITFQSNGVDSYCTGKIYNSADSVTLTAACAIVAGVATFTILSARFVSIDTEALAPTDDVDTITPPTGFPVGAVVAFHSALTGRVPTVRDSSVAAGNVQTAGNVSRVLDSSADVLCLVWTGTAWNEVSFSSN